MAIDIAIVLTATIVPNATFVAHSDPALRRAEYLAAIKYYKNFAPVYFLENSSYPLLSDSDFLGMEGVYLRKLTPSGHFDRGKGYQEFAMINEWLDSETVLPKRFIKITGRYQIHNFKNIYQECLNERSERFVIDQLSRAAVALTRLFYIGTECYRKNLKDFYLDCNDERGDWAERVLYKKLRGEKMDCKLFCYEPMWRGVDGSTGVSTHSAHWKHTVKGLLRRVNRLIDRKYILYR